MNANDSLRSYLVAVLSSSLLFYFKLQINFFLLNTSSVMFVVVYIMLKLILNCCIYDPIAPHN
jgi:hypothetical protein